MKEADIFQKPWISMERGEVHLKHVSERTWKNKHKRKFNAKITYPKLNEEEESSKNFFINDCIVTDAEAGLVDLISHEQ